MFCVWNWGMTAATLETSVRRAAYRAEHGMVVDNPRGIVGRLD